MSGVTELISIGKILYGAVVKPAKAIAEAVVVEPVKSTVNSIANLQTVQRKEQLTRRIVLKTQVNKKSSKLIGGLIGCAPSLIAGAAKVNPHHCYGVTEGGKGTISLNLDKEDLSKADKIVLTFEIIYKSDTSYAFGSYTISLPDLDKSVEGDIKETKEHKIELSRADIIKLLDQSESTIRIQAKVRHTGDWCLIIELKNHEIF